MANQKQRERQGAAKAWPRRWNANSASVRKLCKRPKGSCFHSVKGAGGPPSVSVKEIAKSEELRSEFKRLKAELAEANKAAAAAAKAPAEEVGMEDAARIVELRDQIDGLEKLPDSSGAIAALRTALNAKPLPIQIQRVSQQIAVVEKRKAVKQEHLDGLDQQIAELQQQRLEAARGLAAIQVELVELEAQRTKASLDSVLPSVRMSTAELEQVATNFGADAGLARELASVVGRVREAAVKAQADGAAEVLKAFLEAMGMGVPEWSQQCWHWCECGLACRLHQTELLLSELSRTKLQNQFCPTAAGWDFCGGEGKLDVGSGQDAGAPISPTGRPPLAPPGQHSAPPWGAACSGGRPPPLPHRHAGRPPQAAAPPPGRSQAAPPPVPAPCREPPTIFGPPPPGGPPASGPQLTARPLPVPLCVGPATDFEDSSGFDWKDLMADESSPANWQVEDSPKRLGLSGDFEDSVGPDLGALGLEIFGEPAPQARLQSGLGAAEPPEAPEAPQGAGGATVPAQTSAGAVPPAVPPRPPALAGGPPGTWATQGRPGLPTPLTRMQAQTPMLGLAADFEDGPASAALELEGSKRG
ncbi:unnamed protein product [Prorocentrum cordatum]|uniref:Uncharacterized protein n=1 Tax=Prorocentrum cordatum TaxID=2364126 RepID=A0ABN9T0S5_9DINO|nr:unnamed protein product [Polarella glacialis]